MLQCTTLQYTTIHCTNYTTPQLQLHLHYTTLHLAVAVRRPLQLVQPFQKTQLQVPFGGSVDSLCHPWVTTANLSYRFHIFDTCATALCGTTGIYIYVYIHVCVYGCCHWHAASPSEARGKTIWEISEVSVQVGDEKPPLEECWVLFVFFKPWFEHVFLMFTNLFTVHVLKIFENMCLLQISTVSNSR